jgi:hypothetical protein
MARFRTDPRDRQLPGQLLLAIAESQRTSYSIATEAGLAPAVINRFVSGMRGLSLESAGKVAEALGLRLESVRGRGRPAKPRASAIGVPIAVGLGPEGLEEVVDQGLELRERDGEFE